MAETATASLSVQQGLEDLTECSIHCGTYENPRQLPCLHSFCLQCLVNYTKDKPPANNITCPLCRKEIKVPDDGIEGFPRNFFIDKVIEIKRLTGPLQKDTLCDICQEDEDLTSDDVPVALMFCAECRKNLCDRCRKEHLRHNKSHSVLKMGSEEISEQLVKKLEVSFCNDHSGKAVEMFCFDCQVVICMICFAEKHKLHNCSDINNSAKDFRKQMEHEINTISVYFSECSKTKEANEKMKDDFLKQIQSVEKNIFERSEELRRIIDRDRNLLLDELKIIKSSHLKEMQVKDEEIHRQLTITSLKAYGNGIIAVGSASDICRSVNQFSVRTKEVQATLEEALFCELVCRSVSFQPTEFQESVDRNVLGRFDVNCEGLLVKDLSDPEKSLQKTRKVNPEKKESSISLDEIKNITVSRRLRRLKDQVKVEENEVPVMMNASDIESDVHTPATSEATNPHVHSSSTKDQSDSSRRSKPPQGEGQVTGLQRPTGNYNSLQQGQGQATGLQGQTAHQIYSSQGQEHVSQHQAHIPSYSSQGPVTNHQGVSQPFLNRVNPGQGQTFHPSPLPRMHKQFTIMHADSHSLYFTSNRTHNVLNISVHMGNIVDQRTQVLVSSANCQLTTHGSASKAILKAAGQSVVDECSWLINTQGFRPFGSVIPTQAGNLAPLVHAILHAIIPTPQEFQMNPQWAFNLLIEVFLNALCMSSGQTKSVSFPAIGSEIFGVQRMVEAFTYGLREFDQRASSWPANFIPGEIHLISNDLNKLKAIIEALHALVTIV